MSQTPKPVAANADAHREEDDEEDDDIDRAAIPDDATPTDRDGGGGGGDGGPGPMGGAGGSLRGLMSNRKVVFGLAAAAALLALYLYAKNTDQVNIQRQDSDDSDPSANGEEPPSEPMPNIDAPPEDPLQADHEAFQWVFGDMKRKVRGGTAGRGGE